MGLLPGTPAGVRTATCLVGWEFRVSKLAHGDWGRPGRWDQCYKRLRAAVLHSSLGTCVILVSASVRP